MAIHAPSMEICRHLPLSYLVTREWAVRGRSHDWRPEFTGKTHLVHWRQFTSKNKVNTHKAASKAMKVWKYFCIYKTYIFLPSIISSYAFKSDELKVVAAGARVIILSQHGTEWEVPTVSSKMDYKEMIQASIVAADGGHRRTNMETFLLPVLAWWRPTHPDWTHTGPRQISLLSVRVLRVCVLIYRVYCVRLMNESLQNMGSTWQGDGVQIHGADLQQGTISSTDLQLIKQ